MLAGRRLSLDQRGEKLGKATRAEAVKVIDLALALVVFGVVR